jgi:hypothetical protein
MTVQHNGLYALLVSSYVLLCWNNMNTRNTCATLPHPFDCMEAEVSLGNLHRFHKGLCVSSIHLIAFDEAFCIML